MNLQVVFLWVFLSHDEYGLHSFSAGCQCVMGFFFPLKIYIFEIQYLLPRLLKNNIFKIFVKANSGI